MIRGKISTTYIWVKDLIQRNIIPGGFILSPLAFHYLSLFLKWGVFNLNDFVILRDIYLITFSIYLGYFFTDLLKILRKPHLKYELYSTDDQVYLNLASSASVFNRLFGMGNITKLKAALKFGDKLSVGRWISNPEPISSQVNAQGELFVLGDATKIPTNRYVNIPAFGSENLLIFWKKNSSTNRKEYFLINEYLYTPEHRYSDVMKVSFPNTLEVTLLSDEEVDFYNIIIDFPEMP